MKIKLEQTVTSFESREKALKQTLEELEAERSKQQSDSETHFLESRSVKEYLLSVSERLKRMSAALEAKHLEIMSMIQQLKSAEEEKASLANRMDELDSLRLNLEEKNTCLENKLEQLSIVLKTSQDALRVKSDQIDEFQVLNGKEIAEVREQEAAQKTKFLQLQERCGHLEACVKSKESELNDLRSKVEAYDNSAEVEISTLREQLVTRESELKSKEIAEQDLMRKLARKEDQLEGATNVAHEQSENLKQLEAQKDVLQMDLEDKDSVLESLNKKIEMLEASVVQFKGRITEKEQSNQKLTEELSSVTNKLAESLSNVESNERGMKRLKQDIQALETQLLTETKKSMTMSEELGNVQTNLDNTLVKLEEQSAELHELRENKAANEDKVSKLQSQLEELVKTLSKTDSDRMEVEDLLKAAEKRLEVDTEQMGKERESAVHEWRKLLREKSEECSSALGQLQKSKEEIDRLKDTVVHLENISTSKDQEKMKIESSYEAFIEKTQKREEEMLRACSDLEDEKSSLLEKTRECQAAMEGLKHECKIYQQDCKKACELADSKAQDYREVVDKLDDSQKFLQEIRQKLYRAEIALKESEEEKKQAKKESTDLMKQNTKLKEDFDTRIEELKEEISDKQESFSDLSRRLESSEAMVKLWKPKSTSWKAC